MDPGRHLGTQLVVPGVDDEHAVLGLAVVIANRDTEGGLGPADHVRGQAVRRPRTRGEA